MNESTCKKCGKCCSVSIYDEHGRPVVLDIKCPALDTTTMKCLIYNERHTMKMFELRGKMGCITAEQGIRACSFPTDCAYAPEGYKGNDLNLDRLLYFKKKHSAWYREIAFNTAQVRDLIMKRVRRKGCPSS